MSYIKQLNELFNFVDKVDPDMLFYGIFIFSWIMFLWEYYLSYRQYCVEQKTTKVPDEIVDVIDDTTFKKSRLYALDKAKYSFAHDMYSHVIGNLILLWGGLPFLWKFTERQLSSFSSDWIKSEIPHSLLFFFYSMIFSQVTSLPWSLYYTFVIEQKHGFNKQTIGFYFKDMIKKLLVTVAIVLPILALLIYIIRIGGDYFFIYAWLFVTIVSLVFVTVYADFIAPLFDKYTPLEEGDLRTKIEELAKSLNFPLYKLYVVDGSKRSAHSNAYFYGFFKSKRIVLFDTLIEGYAKEKPEEAKGDEKKDEETKKEDEPAVENESTRKKGCNTDEILAVLAHELGHWKLNHNVKNIIISEINTFLYFLIFAVLMNRQVFYAAFGFTDAKPILIGFIIILQFLFAPYNELISFLMTALSRKFEFQADAFAKKLHKAEFLKSALIKLYKDNLSFPISDWLYSTWHYSHPQLIERLRALNKAE